MIIEITSRQEWTSILESMDAFDVYHSYDYHHLATSGSDTPVFLVYIEKAAMVGIPLIYRLIPGTNLFDATSVYGYPGPVSTGITSNFDTKKMSKEISAYFKAKGIVSVFSRLNPYIPNQSLLLEHLGGLNIAGQVVGIDLTLGVNQQRERFSSRLKTQLNQLRRNTSVREGAGQADIALFFQIYTESMDRLRAADRYYFSLEYFTKLFDSEQIGAKLLLAECQTSGEVMAGSIFFVSGNIVQYHLSGSLTKFMERMPSKLLIDEMRLRCAKTNISNLNLGGGLGCNNDGLFRFKKSFSPAIRSFSVWRYIVDQKAYKRLVKEKGAKKLEENIIFPEYRL